MQKSNKNQPRSSATADYVTISAAAVLLGESHTTVRNNLDRFMRWGIKAVRRTPGGHVRIHVDAIEWVITNGFEKPTTAREICSKISATS